MDFFSHHPESVNMFTFLMDDIGIPTNYRHMDGFGVHAYKLVAKDGRETLVKFTWKSKQGVQCLTDEQAAVIGAYRIVSYHIISYHIISYIISYHII